MPQLGLRACTSDRVRYLIPATTLSYTLVSRSAENLRCSGAAERKAHLCSICESKVKVSLFDLQNVAQLRGNLSFRDQYNWNYDDLVLFTWLKIRTFVWLVVLGSCQLVTNRFNGCQRPTVNPSLSTLALIRNGTKPVSSTPSKE